MVNYIIKTVFELANLSLAGKPVRGESMWNAVGSVKTTHPPKKSSFNEWCHSLQVSAMYSKKL